MASDRTHTALRWAAITPSDTAPLAPVPVAVYVGGAGNVVAIGDDGVAGTFAVVAGQVLDIQPHRINSTSTTATGLIALYN